MNHCDKINPDYGNWTYIKWSIVRINGNTDDSLCYWRSIIAQEMIPVVNYLKYVKNRWFSSRLMKMILSLSYAFQLLQMIDIYFHPYFTNNTKGCLQNKKKKQ